MLWDFKYESDVVDQAFVGSGTVSSKTLDN